MKSSFITYIKIRFFPGNILDYLNHLLFNFIFSFILFFSIPFWNSLIFQNNSVLYTLLIPQTDDNFEEKVIGSPIPVVVDFWAEWCGPCKQIGPILEEISDEMKNDVIVAKHNIDDNPNQPTKYGVRGIPTMLLFKSGELKATKVGATTKSNIVSWIKENI